MVINMRKSIKNIIYTLVAVFIIVSTSLYLKDLLQNKSQNYTNSNNEFTNSIQLEEAYVTKIVDGDTIWVNIGNEEKKVRLIGINCPEYTKEIEPYGKEATQYTTEKLYHKTIYLQKDISDIDSYDRLLRYIWLEKIDTINNETVSKYLFNYDLVYNGLAYSNYYKPDISLQKYLEQAEKESQEKKLGIWQ